MELNSIQLLANQKPESMNSNIFLPIRCFGNLCRTSENTHIKMVLSALKLNALCFPLWSSINLVIIRISVIVL